ncbi:MAG: hypothetical protein EKK45_02545 [Curvibacter sp.]|jgi:hypothetical protein|uniref:hypothetical protein n=1 Tax=Curvibacter lanceolatus TaxID=86182 RepID=UPI0004CE1D6F|nr:hypothetical protein [Curvibacter lanceolatus]RUP34943.1 MAG: hypothetical protein EKK45_02545 [Curvibacter sp.]
MFKAHNLLITYSLAADPIHPGRSEKGVTESPLHQVLSNSRAEAVAQRNAAKQSLGPTCDALDYPAPEGDGLSHDLGERETLRTMKGGQIRTSEGF